MADLAIDNLVKRFGSVAAVDSVSFDVREGEFLTLLGPSGCGKSTMLAAIAGLDRPSAGRIAIGGETMFDSATGTFVDAQFRNLGLMFQSYALWPHMTVAENLAFPLTLRGIKGAAAKARIEATLALVEMAALAARYPGELSGGQQQRVALARTLVYEPRLLLLDEPLSNLDAKLRDRARVWLRDLQRRTGVTTVYVTHDQTEALGLSDRIVVMNGGRIAQIGTPKQIYETPHDAFVADFIGAANLLPAQMVARDAAGCRVRLRSSAVIDVASPPGAAGADVVVVVRPERVAIVAATSGANVVAGQVVESEYHGALNVVTVDIGGDRLRLESTADCPPGPVHVHLPPDALRVLPAR